jgi:4-amino-4-deoxy-L-arabinose transferase-like glycosyltransferase
MVGRTRLTITALVLIALAVRIGFLVADPHPYADSGLAADSAELARQIDDHGRWFESNLTAASLLGTLQNQQQRLIDPATVDFRAVDAHPQLQPEVLQPVGESVVLAAVWEVTGSEHWLPYQLLMIVLGAAMVPLVYYIGLSLFGRRRAAYLAALLYAIFPPLAWLTTIPHLDAWSVDLTIVITALLVRAWSGSNRTRWLLLAGVTIGLGTYFRPGVLLLAPFFGLACLTRKGWRDAVRLAVVPSLVAALLLVPWTIRNENVFHRFIPTRIGIGQNLWEGLGEVHNNFGAVLDDAATFQQVHAVAPNLVYGSPAYDSFLYGWAKHAIRTHPGFYAKLVARRLVNNTALLRNSDWAGTIVPPGQSGLGFFGYARHRFGDLLIIALEPLLFLLSAITIIVTRRRFGRAHLIAGSVVVATLLPYLLLHVEARYLLPASFVYLIWTGLGIDVFVDYVRSRRRPAAVPANPRTAPDWTTVG